jgi:hypothetical protein
MMATSAAVDAARKRNTEVDEQLEEELQEHYEAQMEELTLLKKKKARKRKRVQELEEESEGEKPGVNSTDKGMECGQLWGIENGVSQRARWNRACKERAYKVNCIEPCNGQKGIGSCPLQLCGCHCNQVKKRKSWQSQLGIGRAC